MSTAVVHVVCALACGALCVVGCVCAAGALLDGAWVVALVTITLAVASWWALHLLVCAEEAS